MGYLKYSILWLYVYFLTGCITLGTETTMPREINTGIYEVKESKKAGKEKKTERKELVIKVVPEEKVYSKDHYFTYPKKYHPGPSKVAISTETTKVKIKEGTDYISAISREKGNEESNWKDLISCSVVYGRARLWTSLTSDFSSNVVNIPKWQNSLLIGGEGIEAEFRHNIDKYESDPFFSVGFRLGGYGRIYENNNFTIGNYNVTENVTTWLTTICLDVRYYLGENPFYLSGGLGILNYGVSTSITTNIPQYEYKGIDGSRTLFATNIGAGFIWPGESRWQIRGDTGFWIPYDDEAVLEKVVGQITGGVQFNF